MQEAARIAPAHVDFGDVMPTGGNALRDPLQIDLNVISSKVYEVDPEIPRPSQTYQAHRALTGQRRFDAECLAGGHTFARKANSRTASTQSLIELCTARTSGSMIEAPCLRR